MTRPCEAPEDGAARMEQDCSSSVRAARTPLVRPRAGAGNPGLASRRIAPVAFHDPRQSLHRHFSAGAGVHPPVAARSPTWRAQPTPLQWKWLSALVLLVLLAGPGATAHARSDPMVEAVQRALSERGFDPGRIDDTVGPRTRGAIREFQRSVGLPDTGRIDEATLAALGLAPADDVEPEAGTPQGEEPAPAPGGEDPEAGTPPTISSPEPDPDASESKAPSARPSAEPGSDTSGAEAPRSEPAPEHTPARRLSFAMLGWHPPQTGADALARFDAIGAPPGFKRGTETLVVPKGDLIFVLKAGERIPGIDCDPGAGRLSVEFIFGPDGPVIFTPAAGGGYCQAGIGIVLAVGRTLEMGRVDWGDVQYPRRAVRITNRGLEYVR